MAGPVDIRGTSNGAADATQAVLVAVPGLSSLPEGEHYTLIGVRSAHPESHNGTTGLNAALGALADSLAAYAALIPTMPDSLKPTGRFPNVLAINDMSLPLGGLFDLDANWTCSAGHCDHRVGTNADIDVRRGAEDDDYARYVQLIWQVKLGHELGDERTDHNHYHLRF